jgi:hypothetical protein
MVWMAWRTSKCLRTRVGVLEETGQGGALHRGGPRVHLFE